MMGSKEPLPSCKRAKSAYTMLRLYLVLSDDSVGLRRLPPLQDDLLLVSAALDGLQRNCPGNCREHSEASLSAEQQVFELHRREPQATRSGGVTESSASFLLGFMMQTNQSMLFFHYFLQEAAVMSEWAFSSLANILLAGGDII